MSLRTTLLQVAVLLSAGCGAESTASSAPDGSAADAGPDAPAPACGGCNCGSPAVTSAPATSAQACAIAAASSEACTAVCDAANHTTHGAGYVCMLPPDYAAAYNAANADGGSPADGGGGDAGAVCPTVSGVVIHCGYLCLGRRTDGIAEPHACDEGSLGEIFAARAYLEEVSVHAFARLERELAFHRAPAALLGDARRAKRDEVRHTAIMGRLATRFGASPQSPLPPGAAPVRSLVAIAIENAVEGCVRETYGAVVGLLEAMQSSDVELAGTLQRIATDECRHAELARAVATWVEPMLTSAEREQVEQAAREAIAALARDGDARVVGVLEEMVWRKAA